jgi:hypothetical protein
MANQKPQTQIEKFNQGAREPETDDDEKRFDERLGEIARQKPDGALPPSRNEPKKKRE